MYRIDQGKLANLRKAKNMSLDDLGKRFLVSSSYLCNVEKGRKPMTMKVLCDYSDFLGMKPSALLAKIEKDVPRET